MLTVDSPARPNYWSTKLSTTSLGFIPMTSSMSVSGSISVSSTA